MSPNESNVRAYSLTHALISAGVCAVLLVIGIILLRNFGDYVAEPAGESTATHHSNTSNPSKPTDDPAASKPDTEEDRIDTTNASLDRLYDQTQQKIGSLEGELATANKELTEARNQIDELFDKLKQFEVVRASADAQNVAVQDHAEKIRSELQILTAELTSWNTQFTSIMTGDSGKKIVTAGDYIDFFSTMVQKNRPSEAELGVWRKQLDKLLEPLRAASEKPDQTLVVTEDFVALLDDLTKKIRMALDELRQDQKMVDVILRDTAAATPADVTLDEALAQRKEEETRLLSQRVAQARKSELENSAQLLEEAEKNRVAAEAAKQKQTIDNERQRIELATQKLKDEAATEKDKFAAEQAKAKLSHEMDSQMQEIQSVLQPFITPGFTQPLDAVHFESTLDKKPVSFSKIQGAGALAADMKGLSRLMSLGVSNENDRPKGGFPVFQQRNPAAGMFQGFIEKDPQLRARLQRIQELLNKYGPLLVERGLLSP